MFVLIKGHFCPFSSHLCKHSLIILSVLAFYWDVNVIESDSARGHRRLLARIELEAWWCMLTSCPWGQPLTFHPSINPSIHPSINPSIHDRTHFAPNGVTGFCWSHSHTPRTCKLHTKMSLMGICMKRQSHNSGNGNIVRRGIKKSYWCEWEAVLKVTQMPPPLSWIC